MQLGLGDFVLGHFAHVRVAVLEQRLGAFKIALHFAQLPVGTDHRLHFGVFLGIGAEVVLVADHLGIAEQGSEFFETVLERVQFVQQ